MTNVLVERWLVQEQHVEDGTVFGGGLTTVTATSEADAIARVRGLYGQRPDTEYRAVRGDNPYLLAPWPALPSKGTEQ